MARLATKTPRPKSASQAPRAETDVQRERAILRVVEEDQLRIALQLHDTVCQSLSGLRLSVAALRRKSQDLTGQAATEYAHLEEVASKAIGDLHEIIRSLQPVEVSPAELPVVLEDVARDIRGPVDCEFRSSGRPLVADMFTASQIARIARAAARHAAGTKHTRKILIEWQDAPGVCVLRVSADQPGFAQLEAPVDRVGWNLVLRRAAAIGATLTIEQDGTAMQLALPAVVTTGDN